MNSDNNAMTDAEKIASAFHATYEALAPSAGYETRRESAVPWAEVPDRNRALMIATVEALLDAGVIVPGEDDPRHVIDLRADGWTIRHPLACRPKLFDCPVNRAAEWNLRERPAAVGRYVCGIDDDGRLVIDRALEVG